MMFQSHKTRTIGLISKYLLLAVFFAGPCGGDVLPAKIIQVEDRVNPIGIDDVTPEFSWEFADSQGDQAQTAYQILVASSPEKLSERHADKWDSHKVSSANCAYISYQGSQLKSREICYWVIRTWNRQDQVGPWSTPQQFEMGLLDNTDWHGQWIWREDVTERIIEKIRRFREKERQGGVLRGTVSDENGRVAAGLDVVLFGQSWATHLLQPEPPFRRNATTGKSGEFLFENLPVGKYELRSVRGNYTACQEREIKPASLVFEDIKMILQAGGEKNKSDEPKSKTADSQIDLSPSSVNITHSIEGRLVASDDQTPIDNQRIVLQNSASKDTWGVVTDTRGQFRFEAIPAGKYQLQVPTGFVSLKSKDRLDNDLPELVIPRPADAEAILLKADVISMYQKRRSHTYFRKIFELPDKMIARGRVYITACQQQELYINGVLVGKGPNFAYPDSAYYQTFDITSRIQPGKKNVIAVLGHWFGPGQGRPAGKPGLLVEMVVDFADGDVLRIVSDKSWRSNPAEWVVTETKKLDFRNVEGIPAEHIDARKHPVGWEQADFDDSTWSNALELGPHPTEPWSGRLIAQNTRIAEYEIPPVSIKKIGPGHFVADFGKVYSGRPTIDFSGGQPGEIVQIKADYRTQPDGTLKGYAQSTNLKYTYVFRGGNERFLPFWYLAFRYIEVEDSPCELTDKNLRMIVRHHQVDDSLSSFECSNAAINAIWDLAKRSSQMGMQENYVDTPTREQGQFTCEQDALAAMKCFRERTLTQKAIREFAQSQARFHADTGDLNCVYPNGDGKRSIPDWTQSWVWWVWEYYIQTGDQELVREVFEPLVRVGRYVHSAENPKTGLIDFGNATRYGGGIVDWPQHYGYDLRTTQRTIMSINAWRDYRCIAEAANLLGRPDIENTFCQYADKILTVIRRFLWDPGQQAYIDGLYADGAPSYHASQQTNAMMLALNLVEPDKIPMVLDTVRCAGHTTSPLLAHFLVQAYGNYDQQDAFYEYLLNPRGRNWAYIIADGGTFTYENWRGRLAPREDSESHPYTALGAIIALQDYILGVKPLKPQHERIQIKPLVGELTFARGVVPTQRGPVAIDWQNNHSENVFTLTVTLPGSTAADVYLPKSDRSDAIPTVTLDGQKINAQDVGNYLRIENIGSGQHALIRHIQ